MKQLWIGGMGLAVAGLIVGVAFGQTPNPSGSVSPLRVTLGQPQALDDEAQGPIVDPAVTPISFNPLAPTYRMQSPEPFQADHVRSRPMPAGPVEGNFATGSGANQSGSGFATNAEPPLVVGPQVASPLVTGNVDRVIASSGPVSSTSTGSCGDSCCGSTCGSSCGGCGDWSDCCDPCKKPWFGCCKKCCPLDPHCIYISAEYLAWWIKNGNTPPLVTTGPFNPTDPLGSSGIIGAPGTAVLFQNLDNDVFSGGRFTIGWWPDPCCQSWGIEVSGFFLGQRSVGFFADSSQFPVLARPFFQANGFPGQAGLPQGPSEFSEITARPDLANGSIFVDAPSRLWGIESNFRCNLCCGCHYRLDWLLGFRYVELDESLNIGENITTTVDNNATGFPAGTNIVVLDHFATRNQFYGGQIGLASTCRWNRWSLDLRAKVALGTVHQTVDVLGAQVVTQPGQAPQNFQGGLLALSSNSGHFSRNRFAAIPEFGINLGYDITPNWRIFVGYTFMYWSNVARPGDQIDRVLNVNKIPNFLTSTNAGPNRPIMPFNSTDFWAQGANVGLEFKY